MNLSSNLFNKGVVLFVLKFGVVFCVLYFGTLLIIGLSVPQGYYSPFVATNLNFVDWLRATLLYSGKEVLSWFGYQTYVADKYDLFFKSGYGIRMVYTCVGYGVMSFWAAFVIANKGSFKKKTIWILGGFVALWIINVLRVVIILIAINKRWPIPFGLDHHTWFNIAAYLLIFVLIYFYDRSSKVLQKT